jgi:hypothetical protein
LNSRVNFRLCMTYLQSHCHPKLGVFGTGCRPRRVVVVRAFVKKTQKTPRSDIELALRRAKEVT